jgi:hypothetical protein
LVSIDVHLKKFIPPIFIVKVFEISSAFSWCEHCTRFTSYNVTLKSQGFSRSSLQELEKLSRSSCFLQFGLLNINVFTSRELQCYQLNWHYWSLNVTGCRVRLIYWDVFNSIPLWKGSLQVKSEVVLTMVCNNQNHWGSWHCPSSGILNTRKHDDSETKSVDSKNATVRAITLVPKRLITPRLYFAFWPLLIGIRWMRHFH